jgi:hypothetical protein
LPQEGGGHDADQHGGDELAAHGHHQHGHGNRDEGGGAAALEHRRRHEGDEDGARQVAEESLDPGRVTGTTPMRSTPPARVR